MPRPHRPQSIGGSLLSSLVLALAIVGLTVGDLGVAATASAAPEPPEAEISAEEALEELTAPIALYPDELLGVVLPASTYPLQIVQAARFLEKRKTDASLEPDESWDPSVLALLNYPDVLEIMNRDLDWTWALGEAVADDPEAVMAAIQRFRTRVDAAGNLKSNDKMKVRYEAAEDGEPTQQIIIIESASPEVIYVPVYRPSVVVIHHTSPYPWYYSSPYPYYYHRSAIFWSGWFFGAPILYSLHWNHHRHRHGHYGGNIRVHRNIDVNVNRTVRVRRDSGTVWSPDRSRGRKSGARPRSTRDDRRHRDVRSRTGPGPDARPRSSDRQTDRSPTRTRRERSVEERRTRDERRAEPPKREETTRERPKREETRTDRPKREEPRTPRVRTKREDAQTKTSPGERPRTRRDRSEGRRTDRRAAEVPSVPDKVERSREGRAATRSPMPDRSRRGSFGDYDRGSRSREHSTRGAGSRSGSRRSPGSRRDRGGRR